MVGHEQQWFSLNGQHVNNSAVALGQQWRNAGDLNPDRAHDVVQNRRNGRDALEANRVGIL
jgi:hypothetical protein